MKEELLLIATPFEFMTRQRLDITQWKLVNLTMSCQITDYLRIPVIPSLSVDPSNQAFVFLFVGISAGDKRCSCYTFINITPSSWIQAKGICEILSAHLVVMETEQEWEFINMKIQTRKGVNYNEWYIGLYKNATTGNWTWINGKSLTIDKWQDSKPRDSDLYAVIAKEFPEGFRGSFNSINENVIRGWICEKETGIKRFQYISLLKTGSLDNPCY